MNTVCAKKAGRWDQAQVMGDQGARMQAKHVRNTKEPCDQRRCANGAESAEMVCGFQTGLVWNLFSEGSSGFASEAASAQAHLQHPAEARLPSGTIWGSSVYSGE